MFRRILLAGAAALFSLSAHAEMRGIKMMDAEWGLFYDTDNNNCMIIKKFNLGTVISGRYFDSNKALAVTIDNPKQMMLAGVTSVGEYEAKFVIDSRPAWTGTGQVFRATDGGLIMRVMFPVSFISEFAHGMKMAVVVNGSEITNLGLAGTYNAMYQMLTCAAEVRQR